MKQDIEQSLKGSEFKQFVIFVTLRGLKMIFFSSYNVLHTYIRSQFQNICYNTEFSNILIHQNYGDLGMLLLNIFEHRNKNLK